MVLNWQHVCWVGQEVSLNHLHASIVPVLFFWLKNPHFIITKIFSFLANAMPIFVNGFFKDGYMQDEYT